MMIMLDSQQHGTAETEIMMEGEIHRGKRERENGSAERDRNSQGEISAVCRKNRRREITEG